MLPRLAARLRAGALATLIGFTLRSVALAAGTPVVPDEPGAVVLPGPATLHAIAADLDGDGSRELVRLVGGPETSGRVEAEAWHLTTDGWARAGDAVVVSRGTSVEEAFTERATARTGSTPTYVGEPARLVAWHDGTRQRVLIAALGDQPFGIPCCLTLWEPVILGGELVLVARNDPNGGGETLHALDLDGDGVDELLVTQSQHGLETPGADVPLEVEVLGWDGTAFRSIDRHTFEQGGGSPVWLIGNSDGRPGDEAAFVQAGPGPAVLARLSLADGKLRLERAPVPALISLIGADGDIVYAADGATYRASWNANGLEVVDSGGASGLLLPPIGSGDTWRLPVAELQPLWLVLLDAEMATERAIAPSAAARRAADLGMGGAWIGALPGGDEGGDTGAVFAGHLLTAAGERPIASMVGAQPVGLLGDGTWMGVLHGIGAPYDLEPSGGLLRPPTLPNGPWVAIVPAEEALRPEAADGALVPATTGATAMGGSEVQRVATTPDGFVATIAAPPGSRVLPVALDPPLAGTATGGVVGEDGSFRVPIRPPTNEPIGRRFVARLLVLTPAGHAYVAAWDVQVLDGPPDLAAAHETAPLSFDVTVSGQTVPGATLTVDGIAVAVDADGRFRASVTAPPWPRTVRLEATDPVGNRNVQLVSVVGLFDYRTLPWLPIVALLTLAAALILFLRTPRPPPDAESYERVEAGRLEEIEAEPESETPR